LCLSLQGKRILLKSTAKDKNRTGRKKKGKELRFKHEGEIRPMNSTREKKGRRLIDQGRGRYITEDGSDQERVGGGASPVEILFFR